MDLPFIKTTLGNGLDVIVHENHAVPMVAVSLWYHVGSKNEAPGQTGFAHLFEHVMFEGSEHLPAGFFEPLQQAGGSLNGSTSADRTNYWEVVPRGALERALWMEADRMGWLLPALTEARFNTQRDVVLNERRQTYENRPYGLAGFAIAEALYPPGHPYRWPTIGYPADLRAAEVDDVRAFFARYYHPANASLAIAGDIAAEEAAALVERLFGEIAPGPSVPPVPMPPVPPPAVPRVVLEDRVTLPRLYLAWPAPALFAPGDAELDFAADFIGNGKTARLYRRLVHERRVAAELVAAQASRERGGVFQVVATAAPGHTIAELYDAITDEVARLASDGPTVQELERARVQAEAAFLYRLQTLGGFGGKSDQLNAYNVYCGTPAFFDDDWRRYGRVSAESLAQAVRDVLTPARAVALSVVPAGDLGAALPGSQPAGVS